MRKAIIVFVLAWLFVLAYALTPTPVEEASSTFIEPEVVTSASE